MTTYTEAEIALAVRGARWRGWTDNEETVSGRSWGTPIDRSATIDSHLLYDEDVCDALFVALLDKCVERGMHPGVYRRGNVWRAHAEVGSNHWEDHANRTLALLFALDAARMLPKEDAK